jgi:hypothetical protein
VKKYLKALGLEQRKAHISPVQAPPLFSDKIRILINEIDRRLKELGEGGLFAQKYMLKRDRAFFLVSWWAADRAGDLGRMMRIEMTRLPNGFLLLNHTVGKTIRESKGQSVIIPTLGDDPVMDPVVALEELVSFMKLGGMDPLHDYIFRPSERYLHKAISSSKFFTSANATSRMQLYFESMGLQDKNFTAHSSRAGCATTLLMLGVSKERVKAHARWVTDAMVKHYTRVDEVMAQTETVAKLKEAVALREDGGSAANDVGILYAFLNDGVGQTPAFEN